MLAINGKMHFIWGAEHEAICTKSWKVIYRKCFGFGSGLPMAEYIVEGTAIHIPAKDVILLLGVGHVISLRNNVKSYMSWIGSFNNDGQCGWEKIKDHQDEFPRLNAVLTGDSKYVIVSPVKVKNSAHANWERGFIPPTNWRYIHIIDIDDGYKWRRTQILMPLPNWEITEGGYPEWQFGRQIMFRTGNGHTADLKVHGFVRRLYRTEAFQNVPALPVVLLALIQSFCSQELIHWVNADTHFAIPLRDILSSRSVEADL